MAQKTIKIAFLVNGGPSSAMGVRASSFASRLQPEFEIHVAYRSPSKIKAIFRFLGVLLRLRPDVCYVFDMGFSGVLAAGVYRIVSRCRIVVDTGDAIYELSRNSGVRGPMGLWLTKKLEQFAILISHRLVVRSHFHQEWLARRGMQASVIPDGVDTNSFRPLQETELRRHYGLEGFTTIGLLGSVVWNHKWQMCYGWELVELIGRLRHLPIKGVLIGDGSGLPHLQERCAALGLEDRIVFLGRIPYDDLPPLLNLMDICLSTQTNDLPGQVRTTGKLPLYLACGRFVLATAVGEANRVLPPEMLLPYHGTKDDEYPARLAERVLALLQDPECLNRREATVAVARSQFDYDVLAAKVRQAIYHVLRAKLPTIMESTTQSE
jgi:glycosyltransferase involved in cell wall biosynthesis